MQIGQTGVLLFRGFRPAELLPGVRLDRIELPFSPYQSDVLPLNDRRILLHLLQISSLKPIGSLRHILQTIQNPICTPRKICTFIFGFEDHCSLYYTIGVRSYSPS